MKSDTGSCLGPSLLNIGDFKVRNRVTEQRNGVLKIGIDPEQIALRALHHQLVYEHQSHHRFHRWNSCIANRDKEMKFSTLCEL